VSQLHPHVLTVWSLASTRAVESYNMKASCEIAGAETRRKAIDTMGVQRIGVLR